MLTISGRNRKGLTKFLLFLILRARSVLFGGWTNSTIWQLNLLLPTGHLIATDRWFKMQFHFYLGCLNLCSLRTFPSYFDFLNSDALTVKSAMQLCNSPENEGEQNVQEIRSNNPVKYLPNEDKQPGYLRITRTMTRKQKRQFDKHEIKSVGPKSFYIGLRNKLSDQLERPDKIDMEREDDAWDNQRLRREFDIELRRIIMQLREQKRIQRNLEEETQNLPVEKWVSRNISGKLTFFDCRIVISPSQCHFNLQIPVIGGESLGPFFLFIDDK